MSDREKDKRMKDGCNHAVVEVVLAVAVKQ